MPKNAPPHYQPRLPQAHERFDGGRLKDEATRRVLAELLIRFSRWIGRERAAAKAEGL